MNAENPVSATVTPENAAKAVPQPPGAKVRLAITESEAAKIGILDRWQAAVARKRVRAERAVKQTTLLKQRTAELFSLAEAQKPKPWSLRKLSRRAGIPDRSLRRIRDGNAEPKVWLPVVEAALARLNPS